MFCRWTDFLYEPRPARNQNYEVGGEQEGERFGAAVAACDLDGDGREDLTVGAPLYAATAGDQYETGRVYVYLMRDLLRPGSPPVIGKRM
jgi:hypothetical protein